MSNAKLEKEYKVVHIRWILWPVLIFAFISAGCAIYFYVNGFDSFLPESAKDKLRGDWGAFGDFFGGVLNPIFSFLALLVLLFTLWQTRVGLALTQKSLVTTEETLEVTKTELKLTRKEIKKSAKALKDQSKSLRLQNFESTFFLLLEYNRKNIAEMLLDKHYKSADFLDGARDLINLYIKKNVDPNVKFSESQDKNTKSVKVTRRLFEEAFSEVFDEIPKDLYSAYIEQMVELIRFVSTCPGDNALHISLLRSKLSLSEILFLFYYSEINAKNEANARFFIELDIFRNLIHHKHMIFPHHSRENIFYDDRFNDNGV